MVGLNINIYYTSSIIFCNGFLKCTTDKLKFSEFHKRDLQTTKSSYYPITWSHYL